MDRLNPEQMAAVALAALGNARRLYDDALRLRAADRVPSAFALAGLAADELGKHIMVASFYGREPSDAEWRKFWRRFRTHRAKLGNALLAAWIGDLHADELPDVEDFHRRRLSATYVDVKPDGSAMVPSETITNQELDALLDKLSVQLAFSEAAFGGKTPTTLGATFSELRNSERTHALRRLRAEVGIGAAMIYVIGTRNGLGHDDALAFASMAEQVLRGEQEDMLDLSGT